MRCLIPLFFSLILFVAYDAKARPISYPEGLTLMTMNDKESNALHVHYSPTAQYSVGWRHEYFREDSTHADMAQFNYLIKRWNKKHEQANLYFKSGAGVSYDDETNPIGFVGVATDWETRRYFVSYENRFLSNTDYVNFIQHKARVGIAPYIGNSGDLHTWLMIEANYDAGRQDNFSVTPLIRLFKGSHLVEGGYNLDNGILFNYVKRF